MPTEPQSSVSRRQFLRTTTATAAVGMLPAARTARARSAPRRLRVGFIGTGARGCAHIDVVTRLPQLGFAVQPAAVCDVFNKHRENAAQRIRRLTGAEVRRTGDYREILDDAGIDVVVVATPDHWHAAITSEALRAGKAVYCERPMTHTAEEALTVLEAWRASRGVMQVGVQRTSDGRFREARRFIEEGHLGRVVQAQTEYFRNSAMGQWRSAGLSRDMTPANIDWEMFLGAERGLAPAMPFDRACFAQWRCYWPFSSGIFSELFVDRLTQLLLALGVRYPRRVTAGGGIFLEQDGRDVPDTATLIADYAEGLQIVATATMCCDHPIEQCIRGHYGTILFDLSRDGFEFRPQRPQVTRRPELLARHVSAPRPKDETLAHWQNFLEAIERQDPQHCHNPPDLAAAAVVTCALAARSYREGLVLEWDGNQPRASDGQYAATWEQLSRLGAEGNCWLGGVPSGRESGFCRQTVPSYQKLAGPWRHERLDPAT